MRERVHGAPRDIAFIVSQMPHLEVVVPLGKIAEAQCAHLPSFVSIKPLPHPQYRLRFHKARTDKYVAMFKELLP